MPTYEYRCRECGEHLEVVQAFSDDPLTECPACGGLLRKLFNSVGISFKGSGFYRNDSRSKSSTSSSDKSSSDKSSSDKSSADKSSADKSSADKSSSGSSSSEKSSSGSPSSTTAAAASA
jgi:putative FmdB family regulatory protein